MKKAFFSIVLLAVFSLFSLASYAQTIKGIVVDAETEEALIGASVVLDGTTIGTVTNIDGTFSLDVKSGDQTILISYIGYTTQTLNVNVSGSKDLGKIKLSTDAVGINEVMVLASVGIDRKTPIAMTSLQADVIEQKLGTQEFPELLKSTPSVYTTKSGGGFGDSRINVRGFNQRNVAVMINGVPVNDMENGWVYWSNWAGLSDVTRMMQIQRGLGAAKIAVPSIGGSINILTNTTDTEQGGKIFTGIGNDGYEKVAVTASTGLSDKGWAASVSLARTQGNGYVDATEFLGYSYFFNVSKRINDQHSLAFSVFGAPQEHGQRSYTQTVKSYKESTSGIRYNSLWGYKDGQVLNSKINHYHKPQAQLNHNWTIDENTHLSTSVYASIGRGGGTGTYGSTSEYDENGNYDWDAVVANNVANGDAGSLGILRDSRNNHEWYGFISNLRKENGNFTYSGGLDARYYVGHHYREVIDLLGGEYYYEARDGADGEAGDGDINNPDNYARIGDRIDYDNDGVVGWMGLFGQVEYSLNDLSAFVAGSYSRKAYKRKDFFNYSDSNPDQVTDWQGFNGFSFKGGVNYNLTQNHNLFFNAGYMQTQPDFDAVFLNYENFINADAVNEKIITLEIGYGFRSTNFNANVGGFYTLWEDKTETDTYYDDQNKEYSVNILGIGARHMGVELDFTYKPIQKLSIVGMASFGDYIWKDNGIEATIADLDNLSNTYEIDELYLDGVHVGDAAQTTASLGINYEVLPNFKLNLDYLYCSRLFANFDPTDMTTEGDDVWEMPDYGLLDGGFSYKFKFAGLDAIFSGRVNNILDTEYFSEGDDGDTDLNALVWYGYGRTWSSSLKINF